MSYYNLLDALEPEDREALVARLSRRRYERGVEMISYQDMSRSLCVLIDGWARVVIHSADGRIVDFHEAGPGALFGEVAAIDGLARSASVVAQSEVEAGLLPLAGFRALLERPGFRDAILMRLTSQIRSQIERIHEFSTLAVRDRLIRELLRLAEPAAQGDGAVIRRPPTHFDLAARISSHREAVSREMSRLSKQGLVRKSGGVIVVPSPTRLSEQLSAPAEE